MSTLARYPADRFRLIFLSPHNPKNVRAWSGTVSSLHAALKKRNLNIQTIGAGPLQFCAAVLQKGMRRFGLAGDVRHSKAFSWLASSLTSLALLFKRGDAIVTVAASTHLYAIRTSRPVIYISDATFTSIADTYGDFAAFPEWLKRDGRAVEAAALSRADRIIYPCDWAKNSAIHDHHVPAVKIEVLPFGPNIPAGIIDQFRTVKAADFERGIALLFVGVAWNRKGGPIAVETRRLIEATGIPCVLHIVGTCDPAVLADPHVHHAGNLDKNNPVQLKRLCQLYEQAHFFILPTRQEAFGIVFSEAQAFGCPSLAYAAGGVTTAIRDGETGFTLPLDATAEDFAAKILSIVHSKAQYEAMSKACRRRYDDLRRLPKENTLMQTKARTAALPALPLSLRLTLAVLFLPEELSVFVAGLRLSEIRIVFLMFAPVIFVRFAQRVGAGRYRFLASDLFVPLASLWMFVGPAVRIDSSYSLTHSSPVVLEYLVAYLSVRVLLVKRDQAMAFVNLLCLCIAIVGLTGILDTLAGSFLIRDAAKAITGYSSNGWFAQEDMYRFGLHRATGPLEHPILFGFGCAIGLVFASTVGIRRRAFCIFGSLTGLLLSGSTAPMQIAILSIGLSVYSKLFRGFRGKWTLAWGLLILILFIFFAATDTPFGHMISLFTLDPSTGYYRLYIWRSVSPFILENPYLAVLPGEYGYSGSVDSVWLVLSLEFGMPCAIFMALSIVGACLSPTGKHSSALSEPEKAVARTATILLVLAIFIGCTVHLWGSSWILVSLLIGLRANLGEAAVLRGAASFRVQARWAPAPRLEQGDLGLRTEAPAGHGRLIG